MFSNAETYLSLAELGSKPTPYKKTHEFAGDFINGNQAYYASCPTGAMGIEVCIDIGVEGYLRRADALKIYELAFFSEGDVLELGTHKGLSTTIIAQALNDRGAGQPRIETVDIDQEASAVARRTLAGRPGGDRVNFNLCDAASSWTA